MIDIHQNIKCYTHSRLLMKYLKCDNVGFFYNYVSKQHIDGDFYIFFPDKLKNILSKFSDDIPYVYTGYKISDYGCTILNRYKHSDKLYSNYDMSYKDPMKTYVLIPTSNKKLISTLKLCLC